MKVRNTFIIFIVSGFWHGANWTFIAWGTLNAIYFLPILLTKNNRRNLNTVSEGKHLPTFKEFSSMALTFGLTVIAWIFFRADNIGHALTYIYDLTFGLFDSGNFSDSYSTLFKVGFPFIFIAIGFIIVEWFGRNKSHALVSVSFTKYSFVRWSFYSLVLLIIFVYGGKEQEFIYFQF
jgi:D-alanyl-lipoteichoic acid acyltransferase DltB (MBOAT superfamily)